MHKFVPMMDDSINNDVENGGRDNIPLGYTTFGSKGSAKDVLLSWNDGVVRPEVLKELEDVFHQLCSPVEVVMCSHGPVCCKPWRHQ